MNGDFDPVANVWSWTAVKLGSWAAIPLRLIVGYGFMEHGYAKIVKDPEHFVGILHAIGVPAPGPMGWATILVELVRSIRNRHTARQTENRAEARNRRTGQPGS